jgi:Fe-S-cluster containining protein
MENNKMMTDEEVSKAYSQMTGRDMNIKMVEKTDTFSFKCNRCGACCMGYREDIILNPYDVYKIAKAKGMSCTEVIETYCSYHIGGNSHLPIITLTYDKTNGWCKLLELDIKGGGLFGCAINDVKPGACMNHPIGVIRSYSPDGDKNVRYMLVETCNNHGEQEQVVGDWMKHYEETIAETEMGVELSTYPLRFLDIGKLLESVERGMLANMSDHIKEKLINGIMGSILTFMYCSYDTNIPFLDQVDENKAILKEKLESTRVLMSSHGIDLSPTVTPEGFPIPKGEQTDGH